MTKNLVDGFLTERKLAVVGASRTGKKFGNMVLKELQPKGYTLFPIHPEMEYVENLKCYGSFRDLPEKVNAAFVAVSPAKALAAVEEAHAAGVSKIWLQQGAQSPEAVEYCRSNQIDLVSGECIFMYAEPVESIHKFHRFIRKLFGRMPK